MPFVKSKEYMHTYRLLLFAAVRASFGVGKRSQLDVLLSFGQIFFLSPTGFLLWVPRRRFGFKNGVLLPNYCGDGNCVCSFRRGRENGCCKLKCTGNSCEQPFCKEGCHLVSQSEFVCFFDNIVQWRIGALTMSSAQAVGEIPSLEFWTAEQ